MRQQFRDSSENREIRNEKCVVYTGGSGERGWGGAQGTRPSPGPKILHFHAVLGKNGHSRLAPTS